MQLRLTSNTKGRNKRRIFIDAISPQESAQPGIAADRFAREIVRILKAFPARWRQLNANPFGAYYQALHLIQVCFSHGNPLPYLKR
jgi:hypothetical protein